MILRIIDAAVDVLYPKVYFGCEVVIAHPNLFRFLSTVDPALDAVLSEYNEKQQKHQSRKNEADAVEGEVGDCESDDDDVVVEQRVLSLDEEVIKRHRLSLDEIRMIPRFKDYHPGIPNEVPTEIIFPWLVD